MKRFLAAMTLGMAFVVGTVSAQAADLSVTVNGTAITFDAQPFMEGDVTLVPMRAIMDNLGATVQWNAQTKTVTVVKDDKTIVLTINSKVATVNGQAVQLDTAAKIVGNRTFVPVKFIAEQFGLDAEWDATNQVVSLKAIETEPETAQPSPAPVEEDKSETTTPSDADKKDDANADADKKDDASTDADKKDDANADADKKDDANADADKKDDASTDADKKDDTSADTDKKDDASDDTDKKDDASADADKKDDASDDADKKDDASTDADKKDDTATDTDKADDSKTDSETK